jgi:transposase
MLAREKFWFMLTKGGNMGVRRHKKYTVEFKEQAVRLAAELGIQAAATKLGLTYANIYSWQKKKKFTKDVVVESTESAKDELKRLRKENDELKKANYILKRAAAFFSQDHLK